MVAEVGAEVFGGAQLDGPAEGVFELEFHDGQVQQAGGVSGLELDQEVDVAVGPVWIPLRAADLTRVARTTAAG